MQAQVRSKKPDRAVYQSRVIAPIQSGPMLSGETEKPWNQGQQEGTKASLQNSISHIHKYKKAHYHYLNRFFDQLILLNI